MDLTIGEKPSQRIVKHFSRKFNIKMKPKDFGYSIGRTNHLLKKYNESELIGAIDLLFLHQPRGSVYSYGYFLKLVDDLVDKFRVAESQRQIKEHEVMKFNKEEKIKLSENKFARRGLVEF